VRKIIYRKKTGPRSEADNRGAVFANNPQAIVPEEKYVVEGIEEDVAGIVEGADSEGYVLIPLLDDDTVESDRIIV
jgi:hypothetical protein